jgi:hypothetical protein
VAKVLRDDQIGIEFAKRFRVNAIDAFAPIREFADQAISFGGIIRMRQARANDDALRARFQRKIALVRYAYN